MAHECSVCEKENKTHQDKLNHERLAHSVVADQSPTPHDPTDNAV